jgi:hypothetical protein
MESVQRFINSRVWIELYKYLKNIHYDGTKNTKNKEKQK